MGGAAARVSLRQLSTLGSEGTLSTGCSGDAHVAAVRHPTVVALGA
jgi:hypothetical protein